MPMTFDDHLQAAQAKEPATMHELASLLALQKAEMQAALVQIARGREALGGRSPQERAREALKKIGVTW